MIRKFNGNNYMQGRIKAQMRNYLNKGITFEKGAKRNTCIIIIDESKIPYHELKYMYKMLVPVNREIKEN